MKLCEVCGKETNKPKVPLLDGAFVVRICSKECTKKWFKTTFSK